MPGAEVRKFGPEELRWLAEALKVSDAWARLSSADWAKLRPAISLWDHPADENVIRQGDPVDGLYVLREGRVVVSRLSPGRGYAFPVKSLLPGDFFGEIALIARTTRTANVATTAPSSIFKLETDAVLSICEGDAALSARLRWTAAERVEELRWWEASR